ncbi:MAG: dockerin type I domain-containing protein [Phycisphaerales bacterium]
MNAVRIATPILSLLVTGIVQAETIIQAIRTDPLVWGGPAFVIAPFPDSSATLTVSVTWLVQWQAAVSGSDGLEFAVVNPCGAWWVPVANAPAGSLIDATLPERLNPDCGAWSTSAGILSLGRRTSEHSAAFRVTTADGVRYGWITCSVGYSRNEFEVTPIELGIETDMNTPTLLGFVDCNQNGIDDPNETNGGRAADCNHDLLPDECQPVEDCDGNGIVDICDIGAGTSLDLDENLVPDACQIAADPTLDCDGDGLLDSWELAHGTETDCNFDGVPDSCQPVDFNANGVNDYCERLGDLDGDGNVTSRDIGILLSEWGAPPPSAADLNVDGLVDAADLSILLGFWYEFVHCPRVGC